MSHLSAKSLRRLDNQTFSGARRAIKHYLGTKLRLTDSAFSRARHYGEQGFENRVTGVRTPFSSESALAAFALGVFHCEPIV
jgi:hypothetical protein